MISLETMFQMQILCVGCVPNDTQLSGEICLSPVLSTVMVIDRVFFSHSISLVGIPICIRCENESNGTGGRILSMENKSQTTSECDLGFSLCLRAP